MHEKNNKWEVLAGGNRAVTILNFLTSELKLNNNMPTVRVVDPISNKPILCELAGKTFDELNMTVQNYFLTRTMTFMFVEIWMNKRLDKSFTEIITELHYQL